MRLLMVLHISVLAEKSPICLPTNAPRSAQHFSCQIKVNGMITYIIGCDNDKPLQTNSEAQPETIRKFICSLCVSPHISTLRQTNGTIGIIHCDLTYLLSIDQRPTLANDDMAKFATHKTQFISSLGLKTQPAYISFARFLFVCRNSFAAIVGITFRVAIT